MTTHPGGIMEGFTPFPQEFIRKYVEQGYWPELTFGEVLDNTIRTYPGKEALVDEKSRVSWLQLGIYVERIALKFLELGIKKGDTVIVQLPNWAEFVYLYLALCRIGAVAVMALPHHRHSEVKYLAQLTNSVALIIPSSYKSFDYIKMAEEIKEELPCLKYVITAGGEGSEGIPSLNEMMEERIEDKYPQGYLKRFSPQPRDVAVILTTGGTTAEPKGVPRTHNDYLCNTRYFTQALGRTDESILLIPTPIAHNAALLCGVNISVLTGCKMVLITKTGPEDILNAFEQEKITTTVLVPTQAWALVNCPTLNRYKLDSLENIASGGQNVPPELVRAMMDKIGCKVINVFGMAEGPCSCTRLEDPVDIVCNTVGRPICPGDEFKIVDDDGKELPPEEEGELIARGPCIFRGYFKAHEENKKAFTPEGFHLTGDLGSFDKNGNLRITGRKKDMIIRGGENISPAEIEQLLLSHPRIENVAVIGMPDPKFGERVCAYIKLKGGNISLEEVVSFLKDRKIASFKLPERIEIIEEFPLTNVGKVSKKELKMDITEKLRAEGKI